MLSITRHVNVEVLLGMFYLTEWKSFFLLDPQPASQSSYVNTPVSWLLLEENGEKDKVKTASGDQNAETNMVTFVHDLMCRQH